MAPSHRTAGPLRRWTRFLLQEGGKGDLPGSVEELRTGVINALLRVLLAVGAVALVVGVPPALAGFQAVGDGPLPSILLASLLLSYGVLLGISVHPRVGTATRLRAILAILYVLGLATLLEPDLSGDGRLFLFGFVVLAAGFESLRVSLFAVAASTLTLVGAGGWRILSMGSDTAPLDRVGSMSPLAAWAFGAVVFLLIALAVVVSTAAFKEVLTRSLENTRDAEERYRSLYSQIPSLYFTLDRQLRVATVNPAGAVQLGSTPLKLTGRPLPDLAPEEEREPWDRRLREALLQAGKRHDWEARLMRADGHSFPVCVTVRCSGDLGSPEPLSVIAQDVTDRKRLPEAVASGAES